MAVQVDRPQTELHDGCSDRTETELHDGCADRTETELQMTILAAESEVHPTSNPEGDLDLTVTIL